MSYSEGVDQGQDIPDDGDNYAFIDSLARFALQAYTPGAQWDALSEDERDRWRRVVRAIVAAIQMGGKAK